MTEIPNNFVFMYNGFPMYSLGFMIEYSFHIKQIAQQCYKLQRKKQIYSLALITTLEEIGLSDKEIIGLIIKLKKEVLNAKSKKNN